MNENEKRELDKRMNATCDILTWLDQRIATRVEHQLKQQLHQEREYWRCTVTDLIAEERERMTKDREQLVGKVDAIVEQTFDRIETLIKEAGRK
jgi:hypothetical protein